MDRGRHPRVNILRSEESLIALQSLVQEQARTENDDVVSQLARFLVVRACGFLEQVAKECCIWYLHDKSEQRAAAFGSSWLRHAPSPTPDNLVKLVRRFSSAWADELCELMNDDDERLRREISYLVDRRNRIAHGLNESVGTVKALQLADVSQEVTDWFIRRLGSQT